IKPAYLTKTLIASTAAQGVALLIPRLRTLMGIASLDPASFVVAAAAGIAPFVLRELGKLRDAQNVTPRAAPVRNDGTSARSGVRKGFQHMRHCAPQQDGDRELQK